MKVYLFFKANIESLWSLPLISGGVERTGESFSPPWKNVRRINFQKGFQIEKFPIQLNMKIKRENIKQNKIMS